MLQRERGDDEEAGCIGCCGGRGMVLQNDVSRPCDYIKHLIHGRSVQMKATMVTLGSI